MYTPTYNPKFKNLSQGEIFHVYNRGVNKQVIFNSSSDKEKLYEIIHDILAFESNRPARSSNRHLKKNYFGRIEVLGFCIMNNHFHLILKQNDISAIKEFMHSLGTSYSKFYNKKHNRVGPLFQNRFNATFIDSEASLTNVLNYIHNNPIADLINTKTAAELEQIKLNSDSSYKHYSIKSSPMPSWLTTL